LWAGVGMCTDQLEASVTSSNKCTGKDVKRLQGRMPHGKTVDRCVAGQEASDGLGRFDLRQDAGMTVISGPEAFTEDPQP